MWFLDFLCELLVAPFIPSPRPAEEPVSPPEVPTPAATTAITSLTEHPNVHEICGIIMQIDGLSVSDLQVLSRGWRKQTPSDEVRGRALTLDTPLIVELLASMSDISAQLKPADAALSRFADVDPGIVKAAHNAILDALVAEFAQPVIDDADYAALIAPWHILQGHARDAQAA